MTEHATADVFAHPSLLRWPTFFAQDAQESDQDLEFDEGLEDDDLNQHKPPTRRPLLWILLLLIAVGVVYWTMKPDLAKLPDLSSPIASIDGASSSPDEAETSSVSESLLGSPTPEFGEGDLVMLSPHASETRPAISLTHDAAGIEPGHKLENGEALTIIDGEAIDKQWVYQVTTASGKKGWISGKHLQKKL